MCIKTLFLQCERYIEHFLYVLIITFKNNK